MITFRDAEHAVMTAIEANAPLLRPFAVARLMERGAGRREADDAVAAIEIWAADWEPESDHRPTLFPSFIEARSWLADQAACRFGPDAGEWVRQQSGAAQSKTWGACLWLSPYSGD